MFLYLDSWYIYYYVSLWNSNCSKKRKSSNSKFHFQRKKKKKKNNFQTDSQAAWKEKWGKANVSSYAAGYKRQCLALQALCLLCNYVLQRWREESGKKRKKERNGLALHLHFSRDKTWWRRGKLVFANEKRQGRGKTGVARQLRGGGWKQRFAETAANNYARNAINFCATEKANNAKWRDKFHPLFSLSFSDISRDEVASCLENWILFISTIYCLRPINAVIYTVGSLSARLKPANYPSRGGKRSRGFYHGIHGRSTDGKF